MKAVPVPAVPVAVSREGAHRMVEVVPAKEATDLNDQNDLISISAQPLQFRRNDFLSARLRQANP